MEENKNPLRILAIYNDVGYTPPEFRKTYYFGICGDMKDYHDAFQLVAIVDDMEGMTEVEKERSWF